MKIDEEKKKYGLIGKRLDYSFSNNYFSKKFEAENILASYENLEIENLNSLKKLIAEKNISGVNITTPYKEDILRLADKLTEPVQIIGAANCIEVKENNEWVAHNTDVIGFEKSLLQLIKDNKPSALIFGTGGASKAVQHVLGGLKVKFTLVSRNDHLGIQYKDLNKEILSENKLLINTTPLGTHPNIEGCIDVPFQFIGNEHFCFDLIYNPEKTAFLRHSEEQGATIKNGLEMLKIQAEESWKIWTN